MPSRKPPFQKPTSQDMIQYRSFNYEIGIYHYNSNLKSLDLWKKEVKQDYDGYNHTRTGEDPLRYFAVPEGDEIPAGRCEVVYLPNIFKNPRGGAVGFRDHMNGTIAWVCFHANPQLMLDKSTDDKGNLLFDKVATLEKGGTWKKGCEEHMALYESLSKGRWWA